MHLQIPNSLESDCPPSRRAAICLSQIRYGTMCFCLVSLACYAAVAGCQCANNRRKGGGRQGDKPTPKQPCRTPACKATRDGLAWRPAALTRAAPANTAASLLPVQRLPLRSCRRARKVWTATAAGALLLALAQQAIAGDEDGDELLRCAELLPAGLKKNVVLRKLRGVHLQ